MNFNYRKAVLIFGLLIPVLFVGGLIAIVLYKTSDINSQYQTKLQNKKKSELMMSQNKILAKQVIKEKASLNAWESLLKAESRRSFLQHWKDVEKQFKAKEFVRELPIWQNDSKGLGTGVSQPASQVTMSFDATYRAMQIALMEMETRLPQMQLDTMSCKPSQNKETVNFKMTFTIWTQN